MFLSEERVELEGMTSDVELVDSRSVAQCETSDEKISVPTEDKITEDARSVDASGVKHHLTREEISKRRRSMQEAVDWRVEENSHCLKDTLLKWIGTAAYLPPKRNRFFADADIS